MFGALVLSLRTQTKIMTFMKSFKGIATFFAIIATATVAFISCGSNESNGNIQETNKVGQNSNTFTVKGNITNGADKKVCVYHIETDDIKKISEAILPSSGDYIFNIPSPEHFDFYLLDVEGCGTIVFVADSTEIISINSNADDFVAEHTIDGNNENQKIREITVLRAALEEQAKIMASNNSPAVVKTEREIRELIEEFKQNIVKEFIIPAPGSASAYYALTLTVGNIPIFNPLYDREDSKYFAAVATNFQEQHPGTSHTKNLTEIAKKGLEATRPQKTVEIELEESEALTTGMFDIKLPQENGDSISLSSLAGKVVMLDFTFYENTEMGSRNILLREIHEKYRSKGFEIYQVSLDEHEHFWQLSAANLPWVCVRDAKGSAARLFNVQSLPTFFLISKKGEVLLRDIQVEDISKEIEKLLK